MRLEGKVSIVTGAAQGIGKATALKFAAEGSKVVICDVKLSSMDEISTELKEMNAEFLAYEVNVVNRSQIKAMVDDIVSKWGKIDVLVNNAGITADNQLIKMPEEDFDKVIDVNLKGVFNCTHCLLYTSDAADE